VHRRGEAAYDGVVSYRDPLEAARARIAALEDLLTSQRFVPSAGDEAHDERSALREARAALAEERAEREAAASEARERESSLRRKVDALERELREERARRLAEVSLLRSKLEEAERMVQNNASLFEAEQTMQRAQAEAESARLRQQVAQKDTAIRELREEIRVHLGGDPAAVRAFYEARVRAVGTELAEHGALARKLETSLDHARTALDALPPVDLRDRESIVEREMAKRKVAIGEAELARVRDRIERLELELKRIMSAEAELAGRPR
jgi:DNA repair exonuclease SbcCD ATPase subunit